MAFRSMTPEVVEKLKEAFSWDCTDREACAYAGISRETFYDWIKENPEFRNVFDDLAQAPFLKARQTLVASLSDVHGAQWYMERKMKKEFALRHEFTGEDGVPINVQIIDWATAQKDEKKT